MLGKICGNQNEDLSYHHHLSLSYCKTLSTTKNKVVNPKRKHFDTKRKFTNVASMHRIKWGNSRGILWYYEAKSPFCPLDAYKTTMQIADFNSSKLYVPAGRLCDSLWTAWRFCSFFTIAIRTLLKNNRSLLYWQIAITVKLHTL